MKIFKNMTWDEKLELMLLIIGLIVGILLVTGIV